MSVKQAAVVSLLLGMIIFGVIFVAVRDIPVAVTQESTEEPFQGIDDAQTEGDSSLVWLESENLEYKYGVREVKVKWYNKSNYWILFGTSFTLERKENNEWIRVNDKISISRIFLGIGFSLMPNKTYWYSYPVEMFTLHMVEGEYRIRAEYKSNMDNKNSERFYTYAYFSVTGEDVKRKMTVLDPSKIEYVNGQYGFSVQLPKSWEGYSVITELVTGADKAVPVYRAIDEEYVSMKIRHPSWSEETPYQDIAIVIFKNNKRYSDKLKKAQKEAGIELPQNLRCKFLNDYIIKPDMYNLNPSAEGYAEVMEIFENTYKLPFGEGFGGY